MSKDFFRNLLEKITFNRKGVTLAELLVAIAIMAIATVPFLGSFISAAKNNSSSKDKVYSTILAQKAMDDLKSRSRDSLNSELEEGLEDELGQENKIYSSDGAYTVKYRISEEQSIVLPADTEEYNFNFNDIRFCEEFQINHDSVSLNGFSYSLLDGENVKEYFLQIKMNVMTGEYEYVFFDSFDPGLQSGELSVEDDINLKMFFEGMGTDIFELHVTVEPTVDKAVNFYFMDDLNSRMLLFNDGVVPFHEYYYASSQQQDYSDTLYRIDVLVYKGSELVNTLASFVKK